FLVRVARRNQAFSALLQQGITARVMHGLPLHLHPAFAHLGYRQGDFPVAEQVAREMIHLPVYAEMSDAQVDEVLAALRRALD
ncbi:MAG: hypothetical protein GX605_11290, partial [Chloroflexi bacterium]|nr:hypothetical protein [Chloroflexota bacterium]